LSAFIAGYATVVVHFAQIDAAIKTQVLHVKVILDDFEAENAKLFARQVQVIVLFIDEKIVDFKVKRVTLSNGSAHGVNIWRRRRR
jgi:hypothetical protein